MYSRPSLLILILTLSLCLLAPVSSPAAQSGLVRPSSTVDVVYIASTSGIQTYDVNPQTGIPTSQGQTIVVPSNPGIVPSANDHFIYITGTNPGSGAEQLWVYATDATGLPQNSYIQQLNLANYTSNLTINPNGIIAYAVQSSQNSQGETLASILLFHIDSSTGMLSQPQIVASYPPNGPCGSGMSASLTLLGFNSSGSKLYDEWLCTGGDASDATYNTRQVDRQTGALGPDVQTFYWDFTSQGAAYVNFTSRVLIDFTINDYEQGLNSISVYPLYGGKNPIFTCDAAMLEACGYGLKDFVDPSGNYIFIQTSTDNTQITRLNLAAKKIVANGYYVPDLVLNFSPDDRLVYTETPNVNNPYILPIYTFDAASGAVTTTPGAEIVVQDPFFWLVPAGRK